MRKSVTPNVARVRVRKPRPTTDRPPAAVAVLNEVGQRNAKRGLKDVSSSKLAQWHSVLLNEIVVLRAMQRTKLIRGEGRQLVAALDRVALELKRRGRPAPSSTSVAEDADREDEPDAPSPVRSVHAISGGLPSLGKRR